MCIMLQTYVNTSEPFTWWLNYWPSGRKWCVLINFLLPSGRDLCFWRSQKQVLDFCLAHVLFKYCITPKWGICSLDSKKKKFFLNVYRVYLAIKICWLRKTHSPWNWWISTGKRLLGFDSYSKCTAANLGIRSFSYWHWEAGPLILCDGPWYDVRKEMLW